MRLRFIAALAGVTVLGAAANASTNVDIWFGNFSQTGTNPGLGLGLAATENGGLSTYASQVLMYVGGYSSGNVLTGFCYTPDQLVYLPSEHEYTESGPILVTNLNNPLDRFGFLADQAQTTDVQGAGVQLAIWNVANPADNFTDRGNGGTSWADAQAYENSLLGATLPSNGSYYYYTLTPTDTTQNLQSFVVAGGFQRGSGTPEPFTLALCAGGLGLAIARRRKAKKA